MHYSYECIEEFPTTTEKKGTSLLINKDDSSDKELENEQYKTEEEDVSMTSELCQLDNQDKEDTVLDDKEDDGMFSDEDYKGITFVEDLTCKMNDKARIPYSWILLDSQSTIDILMNTKLLKNIIATVSRVGDIPS